jgi:hypothetical protein
MVFAPERQYSWTSAPTSGRSVPFPEQEARKLVPGVDYFWTVLSTGGTPTDQTARHFRIRP